jgi:hypothetical protein
MPTKQERRADGIAKRLARALLDIEHYDGDPSDVLDSAKVEIAGWLNREFNSNARLAKGAREGIEALNRYYSGEEL